MTARLAPQHCAPHQMPPVCLIPNAMQKRLDGLCGSTHSNRVIGCNLDEHRPLRPMLTPKGTRVAATESRDLRGFVLSDDPQGGLAMGLYGLHPRNTTGTRFTLRDRPGVSVSDRGKMGPRGESNAHPIESLPSGCASGCFDVVPRQEPIAENLRPGKFGTMVESPIRVRSGATSKHRWAGQDANASPLQVLWSSE